MNTPISAEALERLAKAEGKVAEMVEIIKGDDNPERIATTLVFLWANDIVTLGQRGLFLSMFLCFNLGAALASDGSLAADLDEIKRHISQKIMDTDDAIQAKRMKVN